MDEDRFDNLTRGLASSISRRGGMRLLAAAGASFLALARGKSGAAQEYYRTYGEPCWESSQCVAASGGLVCASNGFGNDGEFNCCSYEGGRCYEDSHCCGTASCDASGRCANLPSYAVSDIQGVGDPCQTTDQCRRPQTGSICENTVSTGDKRCCWYEGDCNAGAQCCGSRVCAGGRCRFLDGGSVTTSGPCTSEGCACQPYRDPECRASCPLLEPCNWGLTCTGTVDYVGTCVPV
jgi:hypothetical protein